MTGKVPAGLDVLVVLGWRDGATEGIGYSVAEGGCWYFRMVAERLETEVVDSRLFGLWRVPAEDGAQLLEDCPITRPDVAGNVREFLVAGEFELAFDILRSWISEDDLRISGQYYERLEALADDLGAVERVTALREQVHG